MLKTAALTLLCSAFADEFETGGKKWETVECECSINVVMNASALLVSKKSACPYSSESERKARYEPWTDRYDDVEDRYYCKVLGGNCIDIVYYNPINDSFINGFPCHERSCAKEIMRFKGCAASDELILETYRQRRQIQLTQSTGKTTPAKKQDDSHLPKPESTCMGEYGPEKKRKDGTFLLKTDYNMYGISHIVTKAACEPVCAPQEYPDEKKRCKKESNHCNWSRVYCCNTTMCNSKEQMDNGLYFNANYHTWMDRIEQSLRKKRATVFNSTRDSALLLSSLPLLLCLLLAL